jgi:CheY-like chemotaxis protein
MPHRPSLQSSASHRPAILVVDDDEDMRTLLQRILRRAGFMAATAADGAEGLARFRDGAFDLVITDMVMPVMDGIEVIRALRAERPDLPIVAVSGAGDWDPLLHMAVSLGASAALRKPVRAAELVQTVKQLLAVGS